MSARDKHEAFVKRYAEQYLKTPQDRACARSGIFDSAHLVDALRSDLLASRRKSKERDVIAAALKDAGDAVWALRELIAEPPAQGMEAEGRNAEGGAVHDSPSALGGAPNREAAIKSKSTEESAA